jgi:hypothetical protein
VKKFEAVKSDRRARCNNIWGGCISFEFGDGRNFLCGIVQIQQMDGEPFYAMWIISA